MYMSNVTLARRPPHLNASHHITYTYTYAHEYVTLARQSPRLNTLCHVTYTHAWFVKDTRPPTHTHTHTHTRT